MSPADKLKRLKQLLAADSPVLLAFSGGLDSTLLARVCADVHGDKTLLVTASSLTYPERELHAAIDLANQLNLPHRVIVSREMEVAGFTDNPPERCYYCKVELFRDLCAIAAAEGCAVVYDGSNADDLDDYRPGRRALQELGVRSPLCEAGLTKKDIRQLSREYGLPTADKPSFACLASRFPYGEKITAQKLERVGKAEEMIHRLDLGQFRVRSHGDLARLEFSAEQIDAAWRQRELLADICREAGYTWIAIDATGYRTGALNGGLDPSPNGDPAGA